MANTSFAQAADALAQSEILVLQRVAQNLRQLKRVDHSDFDQLQALFHQHPDNQSILSLLKSAAVVRQDWRAYIALIEATSADPRTAKTTIDLASAWLKLGEYKKSLALATPLLETIPKARSISAQAAFKLGLFNEVEKLLKPVEQELLKKQATSDLAVLAHAFFELGEHKNAARLAKEIQRFAPSNVHAAQLLGRYYSAKKDYNLADQQFALVEKQYALMNAQTKERTLVEYFSRSLSDALRQNQYTELLEIAADAKSRLDQQHHPIIDEYIQRANAALGK